MVVLAVIFLLAFLIAIIPLKARVCYNQGNFSLTVFVWLFKYSVFPRTKKSEKKRKGKSKKKQDNKEKKSKGLSFELLKKLAPSAAEVLSRLRRKLLVDIDLHIVLGSEDPFDSSMGYGKLSAAVGALMPLVENCFRIGKRNITTGIDFTSEKTVIDADVSLYLRVWHIVYVALGIIPAAKVLIRQPKENKKGKVENYGQAPSK